MHYVLKEILFFSMLFCLRLYVYTRILYAVCCRIRKTERISRRTFQFTDIDSLESSENSEGENGIASSREVFRRAKFERLMGRLVSKLQLLLITEQGILLNTYYLQAEKVHQESFRKIQIKCCASIILIIRRPPPSPVSDPVSN